MYGTNWLGDSQTIGKEESLQRAARIQPQIENFHPTFGKRLPSADEVTQVIASLISSIPGLWQALQGAANLGTDPNQDGVPACCAKAAMQAEEDTASAIKKHMDEIAVPLYSLLNLTERRYQDLINYWSNVFSEAGEKTPFFLPLGTKIPKWMSKNKLLKAQRDFLQGLGLTMCAEKKTAYVSPKKILIRRLKYLHKRGYINLNDGQAQQVQVLGDATGIFKSMMVNGTVFVIKVIYTTEHVEGQGVNRVNNQKAFAFYLGDDCRADVEERLPNMVRDLEDIAENGVDIDLRKSEEDDVEDQGQDQAGPNDRAQRVHVPIKLLLGGDLKLITGLVGVNSNAGSYPCPLCQAGHFKHRHQLHMTKQELRAAGVPLRTIESQDQWSHAISEGQNCNAAGYFQDPPKQPRQETTRSRRARQEYVPWPACHTMNWREPLSEAARAKYEVMHYGTSVNTSVLIRCIEIQDIIADTLHIVLRVVPKLWQTTVVNRLREGQLRDLNQWIFDTHGVLSGPVTIYGANDKQASVSKRSWPGGTCEKMLDIYEDVLTMAWDQVEGTISDEIKTHSYRVWEFMILFKHELSTGCDDSCMNSRREHGKRLRILAEQLVLSYRQLAGTDAVSPYMHVMLAHVEDMVLQHGSLAKFSSQGVEAIHQPIKRDSKARNRKDTVRTVLAKRTLQSAAQDIKGDRRNTSDKENKSGGHKSIRDRELHEKTLAAVMEKHLGEAYIRS